MRQWSFWGAVLLAAGVALGAFAAHLLKSQLSEEMFAIFEVGVRYHMYHAIGLFAVAFMDIQLPGDRGLKWAGRLMIAGIALFSGSLYVLSLTGIKLLGAVTPLGGVAFIGAWILVARAALRQR